MWQKHLCHKDLFVSYNYFSSCYLKFQAVVDQVTLVYISNPVTGLLASQSFPIFAAISVPFSLTPHQSIILKSHCFKLPNFINIPDFFPTPLRFSFCVSIWEAPLARLRIFNLTVILNDSTTEVKNRARYCCYCSIWNAYPPSGNIHLYQSQYSPYELLPNGYDQ